MLPLNSYTVRRRSVLPMPFEGLLKSGIESDGFAVTAHFLSAAMLPALRAEADGLLETSSHRGGVRNALGKSLSLRELAFSGPPAQAAAAILGPTARPVKLTIFDKTSRSNWKVPWHQDLTIAVKRRLDLPGYGPWSVKDGVPHV